MLWPAAHKRPQKRDEFTIGTIGMEHIGTKTLYKFHTTHIISGYIWNEISDFTSNISAICWVNTPSCFPETCDLTSNMSDRHWHLAYSLISPYYIINNILWTKYNYNALWELTTSNTLDKSKTEKTSGGTPLEKHYGWSQILSIV